jgi:uncharacterized protein YceK
MKLKTRDVIRDCVLVTAIAFATFVLILTILSGCATVTKTVTGPDGYGYTESITAFGKGSIKEATQSFGGTLKVYNPDGTPLVDVTLDSEQWGEGVASDNQAILAGLRLLGSLTLPAP